MWASLAASAWGRPVSENQVSILLPLPVEAPFDYRVPTGMSLAAGDWVEVPFGP
ncbi:MAG: hypothetical protein AAFY04_07990, partial [Pseudomonadota bacterium]